MSTKHEIECATYNATLAWMNAQALLKSFDDENPAKAMVNISEAIDQLMQAHGFLRDAVMLQKQLNNLEAA